MAKVTGLHQSPRAPSMRRAVSFAPGRAGMIARAWPNNTKRKLSPKQQEAVEAFREAALIAKYAPATDQMRSRELARGSQFLPRDLQYMAIFGRLCTLYFKDGQRRYQLASRYDLTELLDILGFKPGSILLRGPEFWEVLEPPEDPSLLISASGKPQWATPGQAGVGSGSAPVSFAARSWSVSSSNYATKGTYFRPSQPFLFTGSEAICYGFALTPQQRMTLALVSGSTIDDEIEQILWTSEWKNIPTAPDLIHRWEVDEPIQLLPGATYLLALTMYSNSDTTSVRVVYPSDPYNGMMLGAPAEPLLGSAQYPTRELAVGMKPAQQGNAVYAMWPLAQAG